LRDSFYSEYALRNPFDHFPALPKFICPVAINSSAIKKNIAVKVIASRLQSICVQSKKVIAFNLIALGFHLKKNDELNEKGTR